MLVTRILYAKNINKGKLKALKEQAQILGELRSAIWQEYGGLKCLKTSDRKIRDLWIKEKRTFKVLANAWKETLRDSMNNIKLYLEAAKTSIKKDIFRRYKTKEQKQDLFKKLNRGEVRVLLGSPAKMGVGTNVQERLVAMHELDCPWRPDKLLQMGRAWDKTRQYFAPKRS